MGGHQKKGEKKMVSNGVKLAQVQLISQILLHEVTPSCKNKIIEGNFWNSSSRGTDIVSRLILWQAWNSIDLVDVWPYNANKINYNFQLSPKCTTSLSLKYIHKQLPFYHLELIKVCSLEMPFTNFLYHTGVKSKPIEITASPNFPAL